MKNLTIRKENLPANIEELNEFILIGKEALVAQKAKIRAITKTNMAHTVYKTALNDGQIIGEVVIDAQVKLGELTLSMPKEQGRRTDLGKVVSLPKYEQVKETGLNAKQVSHAETLAKHQDIVEHVKAKARDEERIATTQEIINEIKKYNKERNREERQAELVEKGKDFKPDGSLEIIRGDFREITKDIQDDSIDLILTDLPYPQKFLPLWSDLSRIAERVLKPSAFCISYSGQLYLPQVMSRMSEHLIYYWTLALHHIGPTGIVNATNFVNEWKPILIFQKEPFRKVDQTCSDYVQSEKRQKDYHHWQQGESAVEYLINKFSEPNDIVLDPCAGAGTVASCCKRLKRRSISIEIDKKYVHIMKGRLNNKRM